MGIKALVAGAAVALAVVYVVIRVFGNGPFLGEPSPFAPSCVPAYGFSCGNVTFDKSTANLTLSLRNNATGWTSWAVAYVPQGAGYNAYGLPNVTFGMQGGGFAKGETKRLVLGSSMAAPVAPGTVSVGSVWVCYVTGGDIASTGRGLCRSNNPIDTVRYASVATVVAEAT